MGHRVAARRLSHTVHHHRGAAQCRHAVGVRLEVVAGGHGECMDRIYVDARIAPHCRHSEHGIREIGT